MKWIFYIFGGFCFMFAPKELIPAAVGLIVIGIPFHINDVKKEILERLDGVEKQMRGDHAYLKKDIKDLEIKK